MGRPVTCFAFILALTLAIPPAHAGPRLTLKLDTVSLHEGLLRVREEMGWDLRGPSGEGTDQYEPPNNAPRASFNWKDASLGRVCRDIGEAFHFIPKYGNQGYVQFEAPPHPAGKSLLSTSREGVTISVGSVSVARVLQLDTAKPVAKPTCQLQLVIRPFDCDLDVLYGLDKIQAVDNLGKTVRWDRKELLRPPTPREGRPDEWQVNAVLPGIDPRARRLARLEGELILFQEADSARLEVPIHPSTVPVTRTAGPLEMVVRQLDQVTPGSVQIRFDATWPAEMEVTSALHGAPNYPYPGVRLTSGRIARMGGSGNGMMFNTRRRVVMTSVYEGNVGDPPLAVVWDFTFRSLPDRRIPFRLENIPLPFDGKAVTGPLPGKNLPPPLMSRYGALSSSVLFEDQPAGEGELSVGLSQKKPDGKWDAVRWKVIQTDEQGIAVLDGLAPGVYRVLRKFRLRAQDRELLPISGKWLNDTVIVRVEAGKTLALPPLKRLPNSP
jgi:hypothetical protein